MAKAQVVWKRCPTLGTDDHAGGKGGGCQTCGKGCEHAEGCAGDAVHVCQGETDVDGHCDDDAGDDGGLVAQSQAKDDVGSSSGLARLGHILHHAAMVFRKGFVNNSTIC